MIHDRQVRYATNQELFAELIRRCRENPGQFCALDALRARELDELLNPLAIRDSDRGHETIFPDRRRW